MWKLASLPKAHGRRRRNSGSLQVGPSRHVDPPDHQATKEPPKPHRTSGGCGSVNLQRGASLLFEGAGGAEPETHLPEGRRHRAGVCSSIYGLLNTHHMTALTSREEDAFKNQNGVAAVQASREDPGGEGSDTFLHP